MIPRSGPVIQDLRPEVVEDRIRQMKTEKSTNQILDKAAAQRVARLSRMKARILKSIRPNAESRLRF